MLVASVESVYTNGDPKLTPPDMGSKSCVSTAMLVASMGSVCTTGAPKLTPPDVGSKPCGSSFMLVGASFTSSVPHGRLKLTPPYMGSIVYYWALALRQVCEIKGRRNRRADMYTMKNCR